MDLVRKLPTLLNSYTPPDVRNPAIGNIRVLLLSVIVRTITGSAQLRLHVLVLSRAREVGSPVNPLSTGADWTTQPFSPFKVDHVLLFTLDKASLI